MNEFEIEKKNRFIPIIIGIIAVFVGALVLLMGYFFVEKVNIVSGVLFVIGFILFILFMVNACYWIFKDCKSRGENGWIWILIIILISPIVGLLIYFIVRKGERVTCFSCHRIIDKDAIYCNYCGAKQEPIEESLHKKAGMKHLVIGIVTSVLMIVSFIGFAIATLSSESSYFNHGYVMMSIDNTWGNKWDLKFSSASEGFRKRTDLKINNNKETLYVDIACEKTSDKDKLILHIEQGDVHDEIDVTNLKEPLHYPLTKFKKGEIDLTLEIHGVEDVKLKINVRE